MANKCKITMLFTNKKENYCDGKWFLPIIDMKGEPTRNKSNTSDKVPS